MKKIYTYAGIAILLIIATILILPCKKNEKEIININPAFSTYISAFTAGIISTESKIRIRLSEDFKRTTDNEEKTEASLFDFSPDIKGEAFWIDNRTIEFRPEKPLASGTIYDAEFALYKMIPDLPKDLKNFVFQFQTIKQGFHVYPQGFKTYVKTDLTIQKLVGTLSTADVSDGEKVENILSAEQDGKKLGISWEHDASRTEHRFTVDSIRRKDIPGTVILTWNGASLDVDNQGQDTIKIPALGDFSLMSAKVIQQPDQYVLFTFSDPLQEKQNLEGLIRIPQQTGMKFVLDENEIMVYPASRISGAKTIHIDASVKNIMGYTLKEPINIEVMFEDIKPAVRLLGNGTIIPGTEKGLLFPFEAVNLSGVDIKVIRIFENNVTQFLQVNRLDGSNEMRRVGKTIYNKSINLTSKEALDYGRWNSFSLDLAELIKTDPGAIYNVELSFRKKHSLYPCPGSKEEEDMEEIEDESEDETNDYNYYGGDYYEGDYYYEDYYESDYNWQERDNPCGKSYFSSRSYRKVSRNVLSSDLGIIAKGSATGKSMHFAVTNLLSTQPVSDVTLELLNYQQQLIKSIKTDSKGLAKTELDSKPFLLIAKKGNQRGYLRLDDGSSLSLSSFDISGDPVQKGIKGFIYGERGVWRPGDTLFLSFILEDKNMVLPANHPVNFELLNPQGQLVQKMTKTQGLNGFYNLTVKTEPDAPTGNWTAKVKVGGALFTKSLKIEAIKPNRLKIDLDFGKEILSVLDKNNEGQLTLRWLHGAIAKNLKAKIDITLTRSRTFFKEYKDFVFDDPSRNYQSEEVTMFEGKVDDKGIAKVPMKINANNYAPGMLTANFTVRAFEESGDFSIDRFSVPYAPYESFVGVKLPQGENYWGALVTDKDHSVDVVTLNPEGRPAPNRKLKARVYKVRWSWWWHRSEYDMESFLSSNETKLFADTIFSTGPDGKGKFSFKVPYPEWGRFFILVEDHESGHTTGNTFYIDWPQWAGMSQRANPGGATMLTFTTDKKKYSVGEKANISFPSGGIGRALISIESGSKVIDAYWVDAEKDMTNFAFKITEQMSPNVYVNITLVQPHANTANDMPIRMYGVMPILVEDPNTHIIPQIELPEVIVPEEKFKLRVKEKDGKPMTYTIAIVDEGLLDLTRFKTPDPWNTFFAREALGVKTWDMYDDVLGAFAGKMAALLSIGGDEEAMGKGAKKAQRFKPVVVFLGPFELKKGKTETHEIKLPQYIGSVRTMIIAGGISPLPIGGGAGGGGAYGSAEKSTPVRKPLMVLATLPRVVGPGEFVKLPVNVFAMEKNIKNVSVEIQPNRFFIVEGSKTKSLSFSDVGDEILTFDLRVVSKLGLGKVKVVAKSGNETAEHDIEIDVRASNPKVVEFIDAVIEPGKSWDAVYMLPGMEGTNKATLEVSNIPPIGLEKRLKYLIDYPHGCVEQVTSGAFPQLYLSKLMELDERIKPKIGENIRGAINQLKKFQTSDGSLSYWPGQASYISDWGTSYAGHFMLEAQAAGYELPIGFLSNWLNYQRREARNWNPPNKNSKNYYYRDDLMQAYRLYTLALAKSSELGAMNRLKEMKDLNPDARWRLAAAYQLAGQNEVAKQLVYNLSTEVKEYRELSYTYGSWERDKAMIFETLSLLGDRSNAKPLVDQISKQMSGNYWMSTQSTAFCLLAISKFLGNTNAVSEMKFNYKLNGGNSSEKFTQLPLSQISIDAKKGKGGTAKVVNNGKGIIFARIIMEGIPEVGDDKESENNLTMNVVYRSMDGQILNPATIEQGTDFMAEISLANPGLRGYYKEMALTQIFPSGWEIHNTRMDLVSNVHLEKFSTPSYQDIRDDRVFSYFDIGEKQTLKFRILLNASYLGKFYLPSAYCEAMYDNTINARKAGKWVEVVNVVP